MSSRFDKDKGGSNTSIDKEIGTQDLSALAIKSSLKELTENSNWALASSYAEAAGGGSQLHLHVGGG